MSGHSKWAKIKRAKSATDAKRGQFFSKLIRANGVAAREGGDPESNPQLRLVVDRALAANMPKDTISRAIERAQGGSAEAAATAFTLEGYGPGGAALLIEVVTDNRNRTVAEVRRTLTNYDSSLGESGSVAWQFERRGLLVVEHAGNPDALELAAIDAGALDTEREGNSLDITTPPEKLKGVEASLKSRGVIPVSSQITNVPKQVLRLEERVTEKLQALIEELEEREDVVEVTTNAAPPDDAV